MTKSPRRSAAAASGTRTALLDAAGALMEEGGYSAVSSRRVAAKAGTNAALVYYYFDTMDGLFLELFRRGANQNLARQARVLSSPQPLWGLWDAAYDQSIFTTTLEFLALAKHREPIREEISRHSKKIRQLQLDVMTTVLEGYGVDPEKWPAAAILLAMASIARFLVLDEQFSVDIGHPELISLIERHIHDLEGPRRDIHPALVGLEDVREPTAGENLQ